RVLESLCAAGAFDALENNRARVHRGVDAILAAAQRRHEDAEIGQNDMFGGGGATREQIPLAAAQPWLPAERLQREFDAIGFFLSGHPLDDYKSVLERMKVQSWVA